MLVLTRKVGESIVIGDNIVVTVRETRKDKAILGVETPREMRIVRKELKDRERGAGEVGPPICPSCTL